MIYLLPPDTGGFFFKFLPDFGADSFCANSSKVTLFSAKFVWSAEDRSVIIAQIDVSFCKVSSGATQAEGSWGPFVKQNKSQSSEKTFLVMPAVLEMKRTDQHGEH